MKKAVEMVYYTFDRFLHFLHPFLIIEDRRILNYRNDR